MKTNVFILTSQGKLQVQSKDLNLIPTDSLNFLWLDLQLENSTDQAALTTLLHEHFKFHPLSLEDCIQPNPTPKVEEFLPKEGDEFQPYLFLVMHAVQYSSETRTFSTRELHCFLGKNFLVTVHDSTLRCIDALQAHLVNGNLPVSKAPDRLLHLLVDRLTENYNPELLQLSKEIDLLEEQTFIRPTKDILTTIFLLKKAITALKQVLIPQQDILGHLSSGELKFIRPKLLPYFRDTNDSLAATLNNARNYSDSLTALLQVYLNLSSNQTGEVVKILTLITVVTTPLMMIGTWYGMNFKGMPELDANHGYAIAASCMFVSTVLTYWFFKRKRWF